MKQYFAFETSSGDVVSFECEKTGVLLLVEGRTRQQGARLSYSELQVLIAGLSELGLKD